MALCAQPYPWRGQLGRALQGKVPGGKAYGYDLVTAATGERQVNPVEAAIVRRIFTEFANGHSPRAIDHEARG